MKAYRNFVILLLALFFISSGASADEVKYHELPTMIYNGDTIPYVYLKDVYVFPPLKFTSKKEEAFYWKTVRDVKKTLPYAKIAGRIMTETDEHLQTLTSEKERKNYMKTMEKRLFSEFETDLRKMTMSQGKMLIRLIDRECDKTTYEIIKSYKGGASAVFWQGIARIFGSNLKSEYDVENRDHIIERVIILVEAGQL